MTGNEWWLDREELLDAWEWSGRAGVISHQSALELHQLSDVFPRHVHLTVPPSWTAREAVPLDVVLHEAHVIPEERTWFGRLPVTSVRRTLNDCARAHLSPDLLQQGARQALYRGMVTKAELADVEQALGPFGGIE